MPLKGDLDSIDLAHVFQMLTLNQKAGTLEIVASGERACVFFTRRGIVYPHDSPAFHDRVLRLLRRRLRLTEEQINRARRVAQSSGATVLETLVEQGVVPAEEYECSVKEQMEEEIYELFFTTDATFEFREGELPQSAREEAEPLLLSGDHLVMEAARRIDEWGYIRNIIRDDGDIYEVVGTLDDIPKEERDSVVIEVLRAVDGVRTVTGFVEFTHLTRYQVCRKLALLSELGVVSPVPTELLVERGQVCLQGERVRDAIRLFEKAIDVGIDEPSVREMTGLAYQAVGEVGRAAVHFSELAASFRERGDLRAEAEVHLRIRELVPIEVVSRARLIEIYRTDPSVLMPFDFEALAESVELALIYRELGRVEHAVKLVRDMIDALSASTSALLKLADLAIELGDPKTAVDTLYQTGERLLALRQKDVAVRIFRRVKAIDPYHGGVIERLRELACEEGRRKTRRRRAVLTSTLLVAGLVALGGYVEFSRRSWVLYDSITGHDHVVRGQLANAIESYTELRKAYPFTLWSFLAKERIKDLRIDLQRKRHLRAEQEELARTTVVERREDASNLLAEARELMRRSDLSAALPLLRKARATAGDPAWSGHEEVDKAITAIEAYFSEARVLEKKGLALRSQGLWSAAHETLVDLARRYPRAPGVDALQVPLKVISRPPGARILVDGQRVASLIWPAGKAPSSPLALTPAVVDTPARAKVRLSCEKDGYLPASLEVDPLERDSVELVLRRRPAEIIPYDLGSGVGAAPGFVGRYSLALDGDHLALARGDGWLGVVGLTSREVVWTEEVPTGSSISGGPVVEAAILWVSTVDRSVLGYDMADGRQVAARTLDRAVRGPLASQAGRLFMVTASGIIGLEANETAATVVDAELDATVITGPKAISDGIVVGLDDRRVVLVSSQSGVVRWQQDLGFESTVLTPVGDGDLLVGGGHGRVARLSGVDGQTLWSFQGGEDFSVRLLACSGKRVLATRAGGEALFLDLDEGTLVARAEGVSAAVAVAPGASGRFLVATDEGEVLELLPGRREPVEIHGLPGRPTGEVLAAAGLVLFACDGARLSAVRTSTAASSSE